MRNGKTGIRVLLLYFTIPPLLLVFLVFAALAATSYRSIGDLAERLGGEVADRITTDIGLSLSEVQRFNAATAHLLSEGIIDAGNQASLERYFRSQIDLYPNVSSMYFAGTGGGLVGSGVEDSRHYVTGTDGFGPGRFYKHTLADDGSRGELLAQVPDFDARNRGWFVAARDAEGAAAWSSAYILVTGQDMAVAAARAVYDDSGHLLGVVAADLFLSHLSSFLRSLSISDGGVAFIVDREGLMIASSTEDPLFRTSEATGVARRLGADEYGNPAVRAAAVLLRPAVGDEIEPPAAVPSGIDAVSQASSDGGRIRVEGDRLIVEVAAIEVPEAPYWLVCVVLPEADFLSDTTRTMRLALVAAIAVVILVSAVIVRLSWSVTEPLVHLVSSLHAFSGGTLAGVGRSSRVAEIDDLIGSFNTMADRLNAETSERQLATDRLRKSLSEREVLLRELNHRTKNNMNVISAMLRLRTNATGDESTTALLRDLDGRIQSMALVHQKLYQSDTLSQIDLRDYIHDLVALIREMNSGRASAVRIEVAGEPISVSIEVAVPCGLVVNELVTNAIKYAFSESSGGRIGVDLLRPDSGRLILRVSDDGRGLPEGADPRGFETLGLQTVIMIVEHQLQGTVAFESVDGFRCTCLIPIDG